MKYSEHALRALLALESGKYNTRSIFWKEIPDSDSLKEKFPKTLEELAYESQNILKQLESQRIDGMLCPFDTDCPQIPPKTTIRTRKLSNQEEKTDSGLPILLFYRGDINLLTAPIRVAVIGTTEVSAETKDREEAIVSSLVDHGAVIVGGLALGCDSIGHKCCIEHGGKTIAILPSTIGKIIPKTNTDLAEDIVAHGGLLITEYYKDSSLSSHIKESAPPVKAKEPNSGRFEQIRRYKDRDRLQAYFSKAVILISSFRDEKKNENSKKNDSGSRHTLDEAKKRSIPRYVMYNEDTDSKDCLFGMNKDMYTAEPSLLLRKKTINIICTESNQEENTDKISSDLTQYSLFS